LSSFAAALCYLFGSDDRFYLPLLILLVAVAVLPVTWAVKKLFAGKRIVTVRTQVASKYIRPLAAVVFGSAAMCIFL
jgi:hypothetical protein